MFILADLIFVAILFFSIYFAGKKGFFQQLRGLLALLAAVVVAFLLNGAVASVAADTVIGTSIQEKAEASIGSILGITMESEDSLAAEIIENGNSTIDTIDDLTAIDILADLRGKVTEGANDLARSLIESLGGVVTSILLRVISFLAVFLLSYIAIRITIWILIKVTETDNDINLALGLAFGTARGLLFCVVVGNLGEWALRSIGATKNWPVAEWLSDTYLLRFFSDVFAFI